jgi:serine/threonine protein kinase
MIHTDGRVKLMDFGIARPISTGLHTMGENIVGTWQYLSPEQLNHKDIDQRTDIYTFGAILYELLCGAKTFPDDSVTELVNKKARGVYKPINEFPVNVPKKLCEIVDTCLHVEKDDRYPDAQSVMDALGCLFTQYCSDQPDVALKKFMEDPGYAPVTSKSPKKKNNTTGLGSTKVQLPQPPKKKEPLVKKIHVPKLPKLQFPKIPKIPKIQLPKEQLVQMWQSFVNITKEAFSNIARMLTQSLVSIKGTINTVLLTLKHVPKPILKISAVVLIGSILISCLIFFGYKFIKNNGPRFTQKAIIVDTVPIVKLPVQSPPMDTIKIENAPLLVSPIIDEIWKSETLKIIWNSTQTADTYSVHIATTQEFSDTIYFQTIGSDTSCLVTEIEPGNYYCRTGVARTDGTFLWGVPHSFIFSPVYHKPHLLAPLHGDTCLDREVIFQWRKVPKAKRYYVNVAIDSNFTQLVFNDTSLCRDTFINVLFFDTTFLTYYWHVRTDDSSSWSSAHTFIVKDKKNYHAEAAKALRKGKLSSAEKALRKIAPTDQLKDTLLVRLAEEYLKITNFEKVKELIAIFAVKDMLTEYLRGQLLTNEGNFSEAFAILDAAIGLKTFYATKTDSSNVSYARAVAAQKVYESNKNKKDGEKAYYAWNSVCKLYDADRTNERYIKAGDKMRQLYNIDKIFEIQTELPKKETISQDTLKKLPIRKRLKIKQL